MSRTGLLSRAAIAAYSLGRRSGLLDTRAGDALFNTAYMAYKRMFEDNLAALLRRQPDLAAGGFVFDVGANIGYTSILLSRFCDRSHRVLAFEPEAENVGRLERNVARRGLADRISIHQLAIGRAAGEATLWRNPDHHGDHRIATTGFRDGQGGSRVQVAMTSIDEAWTRFTGRGVVSLIKIDVQGFEPEVFAGMSSLIEQQRRMSIVFEYDRALSVSLRLDAGESLKILGASGFELFRLRGDGRLSPLTGADRDADDGYFDIVATRS